MKFTFNPVTGNLDLIGLDNPVDYIQFQTDDTPVTNAEGLLQWNATDGTLDLGMSGGDITMQIGQEMFTKVRNDTGATITNGSVVYISGRTGVYPDVKLARSDVESTSRVLGVATQDILNTGSKFGYVTTVGYIRGIKTNYTGAGIWGTTWNAGDVLWVSKTTAGQLTNIEPSYPHHSDLVGTVGIVSATQGSILVTINRHITGGQVLPYIAKTADYTITSEDYAVDVTANNVSITLPTAVGYQGRVYQVNNSGSGTVTLLTTSSQTINGDASGVVKLAQWEQITMMSDNANWKVIQ